MSGAAAALARAEPSAEAARSIHVESAGLFTTVQDFPGRVGYWDVGVPPSGPMDGLSFRLGNRLLGNPEGAAGLEITLAGPTLTFDSEVTACLTGAPMTAHVDGEPVRFWEPFRVPAGGRLQIGRLERAGCRAYLLVHGGIDVPEYLGSRATFTLGQFGGHGGRTLRAGDALAVADDSGCAPPATGPLPVEIRPAIRREWHLGVLYGPHGAPDFFTNQDVRELFSTGWKVHHNSARTGIRLIGPKPRWARIDGGEAGLHPSNIHDNAYAIGAIDFTGDMPVILGPDGPSLGGFVCPAVVVQAHLWKLGQLAPGDTVRFVPMTAEAAETAERAQDRILETLFPLPAPPLVRHPSTPGDPVLLRTQVAGGTEVAVRASGDRYLLVEFGPNVLDLDLRFRVHALQRWLTENRIPGLRELTPGIRSLQVHFDGRRLARSFLLEVLERAFGELPSPEDLEVTTRIVHLPLSWDDEAIHQTIRRYMDVVRRDAPWCPSNIEFIRRINGLDSEDDVRRIVFGASYLVMGLGDVYLGAPVATPLDPRHRLVTTKYNPARTWTPPNVVGIGGAYLCIYGMEGPGGYQLFGRTLQMWNTERHTAEFTEGKPWLLRFFDQIRFFPVSHEELREIREDFPLGRYPLRIERDTFRLREYHAFLESIRDEAALVKAKQQAAFDAERARWEAAGELARG